MTTYRVMVEQETGELMCIANHLNYEEAIATADDVATQHEEFRSVWLEPDQRYIF